ncbi:MAG: hypothetical protein SFW67_11775 [Myxococcaceae bacterium]|nr:hypothetical protein [Myxococcaceae bacterium]
MSRLRLDRPHHPLAPFFRRRTAHLLRAMSAAERLVVRLLPVLFGGRFRRPGYDKEPPGLQRMSRRRRWGRACEQLDFPPPLGFCTTRPLIESVWLVPRADGWTVVVRGVRDRLPDEHRRLDERLQMVSMLLARRAPRLTVALEDAGPVSPARAFFAGLVAGELPSIDLVATLEPEDVIGAAPTPWARTLVLGLGDENPFSRLLPGLSLASPERFAAAAAADARLLDLVRQLDVEPGLVELQLASRIVRQAAIARWRRAAPARRALLSAELRRWIFGALILPALRPRLEALLADHRPVEVKHEGGWRLELDGAVLLEATSLDGLRARALTESLSLAPTQAEWRRARTLLEQRVPRTLFVIEPGFLKHLAASVGPTGRLRARRLSAEQLVRLAIALRTSARGFELTARPGADPLLVSRLSQIAATELSSGQAFGVQRGRRVVLASRGRLRDRPLLRALAAPRRLTLLPERAEWLAALRPPRTIANRPTVQVTVHEGAEGEALALCVDDQLRVFAEAFPSPSLEWWVADTRALLEQAGASFVLSVSPAVSAFTRRRPDELVEPVAVEVISRPNGLLVQLGDERFGAGSGLGWRALAETVFSRWPPGTRGRLRVASVTIEGSHGADASALGLLAIRSRVLRRLAGHLGTLSRWLEAA